MVLRRSHRKSRHGCLTCKRRRIKCDEVRPVCTHCQTRQEACDYSTESPFIWDAHKPIQRPTQSGARSPDKSSESIFPCPPDQSFNLIDRLGSNDRTERPPPTLNMSQLELLVQWQAHTHQYFARSEEMKHFWQTLIVEEALRTPFLMHGIFGISALHLGITQELPQKAFWLDLAMAHKGEALREFVENIFNISPLNAKAMFSLSGLIVGYAFGAAFTGLSDADQPSLDGLIDIFYLCRGVQDIVNTASSFLRQSDFAPVFSRQSLSVAIPSDAEVSLNNMEALNTSFGEQPNHDLQSYAKSISALKELSAQVYSRPVSMTLAGGFPIMSPVSYIEKLKNREPFSLVVLSHYCAFLHLSRENWFLQSWGSCLLRDVSLLLEPDWRQYIEWPMHEVFGKDGIE